MSAAQILLTIFVFAPVLLVACCIGLASLVDSGRTPPKGARLR